MDARPQFAATDGEAWSASDAAIYFGVCASRMADGLDQRLLAAPGLSPAQEWGVGRALLVTNEQVPHQVAVIAGSGRRLRVRLTFPNEPGESLAYA
jgi:hypothetical protein